MMQIYVRVTLAWWWIPYCKTLVFFAYLLQCEPDYEKLERMAHRAVRVKGTLYK